MTTLFGVVDYADGRWLGHEFLSGQPAYGSATSFQLTAGACVFSASPSEATAPRGDHLARLGDRWLAACDSRIDNRAELRRALGQRADARDADLVMAAYDRWRERAFDRILGDFAIAIYDASERTLILARDPAGQVPLHFSLSPKRAAFASMPSGLRDLGGERRRFNAKVIASHLMHRDPISDETCFEGIRKVRPGEIVRICDDAIQRRWHWQPDTNPEPGRPKAELVEEYRGHLAAAVAARMTGDDRTGAHLSSGFDSSAVAATAAMLLAGEGRQLTAFTAAPLPGAQDERTRHRFADESLLAAQTAQRHGMRHIIARNTLPLADVIRRQTALVQAPLWDPFNMCWWTDIRKQAAGLGLARILTGESGNLTLNAGGLATLAAYLRSRGMRAWWREARAAHRQNGVRWRGILINSFGSRLSDGGWKVLERVFLHRPSGFLRPHWIGELRGQIHGVRPSGDPAADRLAAIRRGDLGPYRKAAEADCGVAELDPLADRRLTEFGLKLPPEALLHNGVSKPVARVALADRIPADVLNMRNRGMQGADWYLKLHPALARELLEEVSSNPLFRELVDVQAMTAAIDDWPKGNWNELPALVTYRNDLAGALGTGLFITQFD